MKQDRRQRTGMLQAMKQVLENEQAKIGITML